MIRRICLIRHGRTKGNEERRYIGATDESLSENGRAELAAAIAAGQYPACEVLAVSPLRRCRETATLIYPGMPQLVCEGLRECDFGRFEGKTYEELKENVDYQRFLDAGGEGNIPEGENSLAFRRRCCDTFVKFVSCLGNEKDASVVCHGGVIMALLAGLSEEPKDFYDYQIANAGCIMAEFDDEKMKFVSYK